MWWWCLRWHMWDLSTENSSRMYRSRRWYVTFFLSNLRKELGQTTESPKDTVKKTQLLWQPFLFKAILETIDNLLENTNLWCCVFGWIRCGERCGIFASWPKQMASPWYGLRWEVQVNHLWCWQFYKNSWSSTWDVLIRWKCDSLFLRDLWDEI